MRSRIVRSPRARIVALAVGVGVIGSLAAAPASFAAGQAPHPPAVGTNCQTDGKISGRGSTFQNNALNNAFITGFQQDVCGPVGPASNLDSHWASDPAGVNMIAYNYSGAANGSGAGLTAISCRTDPFAGTDLPYNGTQLAGINGAPGAEGTCANPPAAFPPFGPTTATYPNTSDQTIAAMNFPIAGGAVAIAVNLNGMCTGGTPTGLTITSDEFDKIWQGTINQWNDAALVATNPILSTDTCSGNIQRVVRFDNSGTTAITKTDLNGIDSGPMCDISTNTWASLASTSPNTTWPLGCNDGNGHTAPNPVNSGSNGSGTLITKLEATNGGIGYAELGLWGTLPAGVSFASLESQAATVANGLGNTTPPASAFVSPGTPGAASNCQPGANGLPGSGTANQAVGLGGTNLNWANDASPQKENITYNGSGYPVCGLTFDFVYTGMHNETGESTTTTDVAQALPETTMTVTNAADFPSSGTLHVTSDTGAQTLSYTGKTATSFTGVTGGTGNVAAGATVTGQVLGSTQTVQGPFIGLTNDQLRTLYSFYTYVFSPLGQSYLDKQTYDELPAAWLPTLRNGFQFNY